MMPPAQLDASAREQARAREVFTWHHVRYEVSPYFVVLEVRRPGAAPSRKRIQAGYDIDLYGDHFDNGSGLSFASGEPHKTISELCAAARVAIGQPVETTGIEIMPGDQELVLNVKSHLDPAAVVRIRVTHSRGLDQSAGQIEESALAAIEERLNALGVKKSE